MLISTARSNLSKKSLTSRVETLTMKTKISDGILIAMPRLKNANSTKELKLVKQMASMA